MKYVNPIFVLVKLVFGICAMNVIYIAKTCYTIVKRILDTFQLYKRFLWLNFKAKVLNLFVASTRYIFFRLLGLLSGNKLVRSMGPLNEVKEPHLYAAIRALFGQPIANTRILTLTAVGINLCGLSGTAGNEPSGDNTKGKCNKSLAEIGKILDKRGRPREKEAERYSERERENSEKSWSTGARLSTLTDFRAVTVLCGPLCFGTCIIFC